MKRSALQRRRPLYRLSERRLDEVACYRVRRVQFLREHPYCQLWLAENGFTEAAAIAQGGRVALASGQTVSVPLATEIHHQDKRRSERLLDPAFWLAVSAAAHRRIESNKAWARANGYLLEF